MVAASVFFRDTGVRCVLGGWTVFTLENLILSENRTLIKRSWGGGTGGTAYQSLYSLLSGLSLGATAVAYWRYARFGVTFKAPNMGHRAAALVFRTAGLLTLGQILPPINFFAAPAAVGLYTPPDDLPEDARGALFCPFDFNAYKDRGEVFGITRLTRRPELCGLAAVGIGGALLSTSATGLCFFGLGPVTSFILLGLHGDRTQRFSGDLSPEKEAQTSLVPFVAMLDGRQPWQSLQAEMEYNNLTAAIILATLAALRPSWLRWVR